MSAFGFQMGAPAPRRPRVWKMAVGFLGLLIAGGFAVQSLFGGPPDFEPDTQGPSVTIAVQDGATLREIGSTLKDADIVASVDAFVQASEANPDARFISPGDYKLPTRIPASTAIRLMLSPESRDEVKIVIPEGSRASEIAGIVGDRLGIDPRSVLKAMSDVPLPPSANGNAEGYLFPATYAIRRSATANDVIERLVSRYRQAAIELELERRARAMQLTVEQVVTIASLLEGEAAPADYSKVARVIYNRLELGMPLQLDSTVNYGLGIDVLQLSTEQLQQDGPYNTYTRTGLPPTPINSPGAAALEAALSPARGDWLYFVATDPKRKVTEFAVTYDEFLRLKAKFKRSLS